VVTDDAFDQIGTVASVETPDRPDCALKFGLRIGDVIVTCYSRQLLSPLPREGQRLHVIGRWTHREGCGSVLADSVTRLYC
jgi:hypothetical protein